MVLAPDQPERPPEYVESSLGRRAKRGIIWNQVGGFLDYALFLFFSVAIGRAIGVAEFGLYGLVIGYSAFGIMLISFGMDRAIQVYVSPMLGEQEEKAAYLIRKFFSVRVISGFVVALILLVLTQPILGSLLQPRVVYYLKWMGPYIISMGLTSLLFSVFSARMNLKNARLTKAAIQILNALGSIWIYNYGGGAGLVLLLLSSTTCLTAITLAWMARESFLRSAEPMELGPVRSFCASQTAMEVVGFILGKNADIIMLNLLVGGTLQVGYYSVASALTLAISTLLLSGAGDIALSVTSIMVQKGEMESLVRAWRFRIRTSILLSIPFMVYGFGIAPQLIATVLDRTYLPAVDVFRVAIGGQILLILIGGGAHADILLSSEHHRTVRDIRLVSGVLNIVLNLILIPGWGAMGAASATAIAAIGRVLGEYMALRKHQSATLPGRSITLVFAASVLSTLFVVWLPLNRWIFLSVSLIGFVIVFSLLLLAIKPYDEEDVLILNRVGAPFDRLVRWLVISTQ